MDFRLNSWDFYLGFGYKKFQTTNTSVVEFFWINSMLVLRNGCKKENVGFLKEMLSKFCKTHVLVLAID